MAAALPPIIVATALGLLAAHRQQPAPLPLEPPTSLCQRPPRFTLGGEREPGGVVSDGQGGYRFMGVAWLFARVCQPGVLTVAASGVPADGQAPVLRVSLNGVNLRTEALDAPQKLRIAVPGPGVLTVGYFNDLYRSESRSVTLSDFRLDGLCETEPRLTVVAGPQPSLESPLTLNTAAPLILEPCAAGRLQLVARGYPAAGQDPRLTVIPASGPQREFTLGPLATPLSIVVPAGPVRFKLANPLFRTLADRNLLIRELTFTPSP